MHTQARDAVLQNIGIAEQFVPEVSGPPFNLATAVWLAGAAFDAYNNPKGRQNLISASQNANQPAHRAASFE